jgi:hypothetical protein
VIEPRTSNRRRNVPRTGYVTNLSRMFPFRENPGTARGARLNINTRADAS